MKSMLWYNKIREANSKPKTLAHRKKLSIARLGKIPWNKNKPIKLNDALAKWHKSGGIPWNKGMKMPARPPMSPEARLKMSEAAKRRVQKGTHNFWRGGLTKKYDLIRHSCEYKLWRKAVFERDNYTCVWCNVKGGNLNADHIKPFCDYPELRFAIDNGRTLCRECHKKTDTWGKPRSERGRSNN